MTEAEAVEEKKEKKKANKLIFIISHQIVKTPFKTPILNDLSYRRV